VAVAAVAVASSRSLARRILDAIPARIWILGFLGALLGIAALFGGLADAPPRADPVGVIEVGDVHVGPQFSTAVTGIELRDILPNGLSEPDEGNDFVVVTIRLENTWTETTTSIGDLLTLDGVELATESEYADRTFLVADDSNGVQAHPRVPITVGFVWQVPSGSIAEGDEVRVVIADKSLTTDSRLIFGDYWSEPVAAAYVDVDVVAERSETPVEE
jgi:hypothetical protein